jgi:hypothetical protein
MGSFSDYTEGKLLEEVVGKTEYTMPATVYVALTNSAISDANTTLTGIEPATAYGYWRQAAPPSYWSVYSSGAVTNTTAITFPTATGGNWGTLSYFALCDNSTPATPYVLAWGTLTSSKTINTSDQASFAAGDITLSLD